MSGMTSVEQVARALQRIAVQEAHSPNCDSHDYYPYLGMPGGVEYPCTCDRDARVVARQAEAVLEAIERALPIAPEELRADLQAAALRVLAQRAEQEKL